MKIKFEKEVVEIDGVEYWVYGAFDPDTEECWDLRIFSRGGDQQIQDHLMDSVVEDIICELNGRYSYKVGSDEYFDDCDGDFDDIEEDGDE